MLDQRIPRQASFGHAVNSSKTSICGRVATTIALLVPGIVVPILEINATHLLNLGWPPHARLHEAWQLITNSFLAVVGVYWAWTGRIKSANIIGMAISGGFIAAWLSKDVYGGGMEGTSTAAARVLGMDLPLLVMVTLFFLFCVSYKAADRST